MESFSNSCSNLCQWREDFYMELSENMEQKLLKSKVQEVPHLAMHDLGTFSGFFFLSDT